MKKILLAAFVLFLLVPGAAFAGGRAVVVVTDAGGVGEASVQTARKILQTELRANGVEVVDAPELQGVRRAGEEVQSAAARLGAGAVYALQFSPLGEKLYVSVQELDPAMNLRAERHLQARDIEELDLVLARLARAIATGRRVEETEEIDTVTAREGQKWKKEPGESLWGFGILAGLASERPVGGELRFLYEMDNFRLNAHAGWMNSEGDGTLDVARYCVGASYLFHKGDVSPYAGVDVGLLSVETGDGEGDGLGIVPHAGVELFRLHRARLLVEAGVMLPFFNVSSDGGGSSYEAVFFGGVAVVW